MKKILFVARTESIHTRRWLAQLAGQNWEIHIFPSTKFDLSRWEIKNAIIHYDRFPQKYRKNQKIAKEKLSFKELLKRRFDLLISIIGQRINHDYQVDRLNRVIDQIKPDLIHSMEIQNAGYLVSEAKKKYKGQFPVWLATNWGGDIMFFSQWPEHKSKIQSVIDQCDYFSCECSRDVCLAKNMGLTGKAWPVFPTTGGFDLAKIKSWRKPLKQRKMIMVKGYQGLFGRAVLALEALVKCQDLLTDYQIVVYSAEPGSLTIDKAQVLRNIGMDVKILPLETSHDRILKYHGQARFSIGLSVSDGISTSFLEALAMGSFPIQSNTSCANEWVESGKTGMIVPTEDLPVIIKSIKTALTDDKLLVESARKNWQTAKKRLDSKDLTLKTISLYQDIFDANMKIIMPKSQNIKKYFIEAFLILWILGTFLVWWFLSEIVESPWGKFVPKKIRQTTLKVEKWFWPDSWKDYLYIQK